MYRFKSAMRIGWIWLVSILATFAVSEVARAGNYGAAAAGINGGTVGVGYSTNYADQGSADARALQECSARTQNCQVVTRFSNGDCRYITTASGSGTCYGFGVTPAEALSQCQSRGCSCNPPVGGCNAP